MTTRTQDEILARFRELADEDLFGWRREVLTDAMTRDTAQQALETQIPAEDWTEPGDIETDARNYLEFAVDKAAGHRGISTSRSVEKLAEFAWLLGRDDVVQAMETAEYPQYGVPKLKAFAEGMGWPWPGEVTAWESKALARMAEGLPCQDDCAEGCGQ